MFRSEQLEEESHFRKMQAGDLDQIKYTQIWSDKSNNNWNATMCV